jgi:GYF domain 2
MQERVAKPEAVDSEPTWYLTRGGEQLGPLTGRELSLFADGGNFKPGDLVWTAGFDAWQPADDVFGLSPEPEPEPEAATLADEAAGDDPSNVTFSLPAPAEGGEPAPMATPADAHFAVDSAFDDGGHGSAEPNGEDVDALIQALTGSAEPAKPTLKARILQEVKKFAGIFLYLWVVFTVLLAHEWIVLSENHIGFKFYGLAAINALVLAKIMLIADGARFGEQLKGMPLVYPIVYKAVAFTTLLFVAYVLEEMLVGGITGKGFLASVPNIGGGLGGALILWLIFCVALVPFFAFKELERVVGPAAFKKLLFGRS